ncbi:MAG: hypothetical protein NTX85_00530 [Candidatus Nomurabacteria bacterium]|nr:hypothetical protein [Candidatus Nomurabacteria bacterium]
MIYIYSGNDNKNKISSIKKKFSKNEILFLSLLESTPEVVFDYVQSMNLFGISKAIVVENFLASQNLSVGDLSMLQKSETPFIFLEDKMLAADEKKYKKYAEDIEKFEVKEIKSASAFNVFDITDAFASRDKIGAWSLYLSAIQNEAQPEAISGILFWKIKTMMMTGSKNFSKENLKQMSSSLVDIYHLSHVGEIDMKIGLEQFILKSLS